MLNNFFLALVGRKSYTLGGVDNEKVFVNEKDSLFRSYIWKSLSVLISLNKKICVKNIHYSYEIIK